MKAWTRQLLIVCGWMTGAALILMVAMRFYAVAERGQVSLQNLVEPT
jgi:hypothetical protein